MSEGIYRRGKQKDVWSIKIPLGLDDETGKYREKWYTFRGTKKEAEQERRRLLHQRDKGALVTDPSNWTVTQFLSHWLDTHVSQTVRPKTEATYRSAVNRRIVPFLGSVKLVKLTSAHLREMYATLLREGRPGGHPLSARSVHHVHVVLKEALGDGVRWQMIPRNVADGADPPKAERKELQVWDTSEAQRFLSYVTATSEDGIEIAPFGTALAFALQTGVRQGEVLGLRWSDVDFEQGTSQISQTLGQVQGRGLMFGQPKTARGRRRIALTPTMIDLLRAHKVRQNETRLMLGPAWQDSDLVFPTTTGAPMQPAVLYHAFLRACEKAGVPRIAFHGLRHTHATLLLLQNVPAKVVSERLGHASIAITLDTYSHVLPDMQDAAVGKLEALFSGGPRGRS